MLGSNDDGLVSAVLLGRRLGGSLSSGLERRTCWGELKDGVGLHLAEMASSVLLGLVLGF